MLVGSVCIDVETARDKKITRRKEETHPPACDAEERGKKKRFVAANGQKTVHYSRKEVKLGDAGDAKMLSFRSHGGHEATSCGEAASPRRRKKPPFGAENFIRHAKGGKIPVRKKGGSYVMEIERSQGGSQGRNGVHG